MGTQTKLHKASALIGLILTIAGFQNCAQTSFSELPSETPLAAQGPGAGGAACREGAVWEVRDGTVNLPKNQCQSGTDVHESFTLYRCENGQAVVTGTRPGALLASGLGTGCTPAPEPVRNCGGVANGATIWEANGSEKILKENCPDGAKTYDTYAQERQLRCQNGSLVATGQTRRGVLIAGAPACAPQPKTCDGGYAEGQVRSEVRGQIRESMACPGTQTGSRWSDYQQIFDYRCQAGEFVAIGSRRGALIGSGSNCQEVRPAYCTDYFTGEICDIYKYLFGRWPDQEGARFWANDFAARGVPTACRTRQVSFGTRLSDCELHRNLHGVYPHSPFCPASPRGDAYQARATAGCP